MQQVLSSLLAHYYFSLKIFHDISAAHEMHKFIFEKIEKFRNLTS